MTAVGPLRSHMRGYADAPNADEAALETMLSLLLRRIGASSPAPAASASTLQFSHPRFSRSLRMIIPKKTTSMTTAAPRVMLSV